MPKNKQVATRAIELGLSKLKISAFKEAALEFRSAMQIAVSYTHLTLPTIYSV